MNYAKPSEQQNLPKVVYKMQASARAVRMIAETMLRHYFPNDKGYEFGKHHELDQALATFGLLEIAIRAAREAQSGDPSQ